MNNKTRRIKKNQIFWETRILKKRIISELIIKKKKEK